VYGGNLLLSGASGAASVAVAPASLTLIDGVWTGEVSVRAVAGSVALRVDDGGGGTGLSNAFDVTHGALDHFEWQTIDSPQYANLPFLATLADSAKISRKLLLTCLASPDTRTEIQSEAEGSERAGASSTPSFYIEGGLMSGAQPVEVFRRVLDSVVATKRRPGT